MAFCFVVLGGGRRVEQGEGGEGEGCRRGSQDTARKDSNRNKRGDLEGCRRGSQYTARIDSNRNKRGDLLPKLVYQRYGIEHPLDRLIPTLLVLMVLSLRSPRGRLVESHSQSHREIFKLALISSWNYVYMNQDSALCARLAAGSTIECGFLVTPDGYSHLTSELMSLADGKVVVVLEGGYNVASIKYCMEACVATLLATEKEDFRRPGALAKKGGFHAGAKSEALDDLFKTIDAHRAHWKCLGGSGGGGVQATGAAGTAGAAAWGRVLGI